MNPDSTNPASGWEIIPSVSSFSPDGDWRAVAQAMKSGLRHWLRQSWRAELQPGFLPGYVRLGSQGDDLLFYAMMKDRHPRNSATRRNAETWKTGDVVELFLQREGSPDYYEFHVTPENQRLQLHFPHAGALRSGLPLQAWMVEEDLFESFARVDASLMRWQALMRINLPSLFGVRPGRLRFLAGRYDAQPDGARAVASASGRLTAFDFHDCREWSRGEIVPAPK